MARRSSNSLIYDSLLLEGGLFVPAILEKAARGEHSSQAASDYHIPQGLSLTDEQGRAFRIATALWKNFEAVRIRKDVPAALATVGVSLELLRDSLGYFDIKPCTAPIELANRGFPITAMAVGGRVPIVVAPHSLDLDGPDERFVIIGSGARRRSAYQLAQQFLNAAPDCTWAIITNGRQLRLIRDADTLTRPAFLEADLQLVLQDQRYPDFAAVWRLFHASRAGESGGACVWDTWRREGQDLGEPVREGLRNGVTEALLALGNGFLQNATNTELRARLESGDLPKDGYFQQLLRLVYRCLFVFTVEERGSLHVSDQTPAAAEAREIYRQGYAFRRFRDRALRRVGFDRYGDLWAGVQVVFRGLANGETRLALPALGGLFAAKQCPDLDRALLDNRSLLTAMRHLRWAHISGKLAAIDYRNMGPEELGSVYESLLELVPTVDLAARSFGFVGLTEQGLTGGNARKISGSYYTPDSLVQELLDSALEPVMEQRLATAPDRPVEALLSITIIDPACGSGHFLLGAARRLAERLAEVRTTDGAVTPDDYRKALHDVIARCIFGVDRNPMALELARTALWLEAYEPSQPLCFLDHHLVCGDALLGLVDFKSLAAGIPIDAFKALTGDSKEACKALAAINRAALRTFERRRTERDFFREAETGDLLKELQVLEALPESNPLEVEVKSATYTTFLQHARDSRLAQAADLVVGAFLAPKPDAAATALCPTTQTLADLLFPRDAAPVPAAVVENARRLCREARVLHWPLAFAGVFARGGFDCVLGNPPWEVSQMGEEEFFASRDATVASQAGAKRKVAIAALEESNPVIWAEYRTALRRLEATNTFYRESGRFALTAIGKLNTYSLFSETISHIVQRTGRAGFIVPTGIATDDSTKDFFRALAEGGRLASLYSFENEEFVFPAVHHAFKFCLLIVTGGIPPVVPEFVFFARQVAYLRDSARRFRLTRDEFSLINPNTRTCPVFRSQADAELTKAIYRRVPVLIAEKGGEKTEQNPWEITFSQGLFNMTSDSGLFLDVATPTALPLYEAKMIHQFDHRWATYAWDPAAGSLETSDVTDAQKSMPNFVVQPRYWVDERHVLSRLAHVPRCVTQAWDAQDEDFLRVAFATWIVAVGEDDELAEMRGCRSTREQVIAVLGRHFSALPATKSDWFSESAAGEAKCWPALNGAELAMLRESPDLFSAAHRILDGRSPRWLMGWRDITNATNERTVIASVVPRAGAGDTLLLMFPKQQDRRLYACLLGDQNSLVHDFVARQKIGGTHLKYHVKKQITTLPPTAYTETSIAYIVPRVLELTYTAHDLKPWAEDLGYRGGPFLYEAKRRAQLRAELDAYYALLYGLTRDELRYILDPSDIHGPDYPSVTFPGLKRNEEAAFGEYRTRRLVLAAWDALVARDAQPVEAAASLRAAVSAPAWMDRPLVIPAFPRGRIAPALYRAAVVPHLVYQAGGELNFDRFRRAYWLLAEPKTLQRYAKAEIGSEVTKWARDFRDRLEKDQFIPHLRGAIRFDLQFITVGRERWLQLRRAEHLSTDEHVIFDARLALCVADLWPSDEPIAPLTPDEESAIKELELAM